MPLGRPQVAAWLKRLALLAAASAAVLIAVEAAARLMVAVGRRGRSTGVGIARFSPSLGWEKTPGAIARIARRGEYDIEIRLNSHGLRGPDRDYRTAAGTKRVFILGDSFAEGYYVDEPATARALLEDGLARAGCGPIEVINGGTAGYSTDQEYLFYEEEGTRYRPDLVLLFFYYNDLFFNTTALGTAGQGKPYFDLSGRTLHVQNVPVPQPVAEGPRPLRGSMALRLLSNRVRERNPSLQPLLAPLGLVERDAGPAAELMVFGPRRSEVDDMWRRTAAILAALKASVERDKGRLVLVYVPARFEVNDGAWQSLAGRYGLGGRWDRLRVRERLGKAAAQLAIPLLDPTQEMRRAEETGVCAYFPKDGHWNTLGNSIAAQAILPIVLESLGCSRG